MSLDLSRRAKEATEEIACRLAALARSLEKGGRDPTLFSRFLTCCISTLFAQDVHTIADNSFINLLNKCVHYFAVSEEFIALLYSAVFAFLAPDPERFDCDTKHLSGFHH